MLYTLCLEVGAAEHQMSAPWQIDDDDDNITYRNAVREGPSHGHAKKIEVRPCSFRNMRVDRQTDKQTNKQTWSSRYLTPLSRAKNSNEKLGANYSALTGGVRRAYRA